MTTNLSETPGRTYENLAVDFVDEGAIAIVRMSRPDKLNAMTVGLVQDLHDALSALHVDNSVRAIVLTGDGRGFCAGLDLTGYGKLPGTEDLGRVPTGIRTQSRRITRCTRYNGRWFWVAARADRSLV